MIITEVSSSSVLPGKKESHALTREDVEAFFIESITKKGATYYDILNRHIFKSPNALRTFLSNLEEYIKTKSTTDEQRFIIKNVFDTIKLQLSVIENLKLKEIDNREIVTLFIGTALKNIDIFLE